VTVSPAIFTGFFIGKLIAMGSMVLMRTLFLDRKCRAPAPADEVYRGGPHGDKRRCQETAATDARLFALEYGCVRRPPAAKFAARP
jgi:hypothetical protein